MQKVGFFIHMKTIVIILCTLLLIGSCRNRGEEQAVPPLTSSQLKERWTVVNALKDSIREGDLVLRCGNDYSSFTLRDFSQKEKLYSHSGIAVRIDSVLYIYHNMAGNLNPDEVMRRDPVDSFLTPENNVAFGIYRYDLNDEEIRKLREIIHQHYLNKLQFDMNFDLETDNKMYCAEMIIKSIDQATDHRIQFTKSMVTDELRRKYMKLALQKNVIPSPKAADQREYYAIDDLYLNSNCRLVHKHIFEDNRGLISFPTPEEADSAAKQKH